MMTKHHQRDHPLRQLKRLLDCMLHAAKNAEGNKKEASYSDAIAYMDHGHFLALFLHPFSAEYRRAKEERVSYSIIISRGKEDSEQSSSYVIEGAVVHPDTNNNISISLPDQECHTLESAVEAIFKAFRCINKDFTQQRCLELNP